MFPIIWRFLLNQYLKVMVLSALAIIGILLTTRLEDIAHFATLDASSKVLFLFIAYQIPYILPIAIPVSCLLSSQLLVQRLSKTHELTAMRALGMGLTEFITPILLAGAFLSIMNFYLVSEMATTSHLKTNLWKSELRSLNPLLLLKNKHLMRLKGGYFDALGQTNAGESASQVILAIPTPNQRIHLLMANKMEATLEHLSATEVSYITTIENTEDGEFDHLFIENIEKSNISTKDFAKFFQRKVTTIDNDHLNMPLLISRIKNLRKTLREAKGQDQPREEIEAIRKNLNRSITDIIRRISAGLAAFTFTLLGISFGITISRKHSLKSLGIMIFLATAYLACFFAAKGYSYHLVTSILLYVTPHLVIVLTSLWMLKRVTLGVDRG